MPTAQNRTPTLTAEQDAAVAHLLGFPKRVQTLGVTPAPARRP
jgi:hypothetical protein